MENKGLFKAILITNIIIHILVGVALIVFSHDSFERSHLFIGLVILITGLPNLLIYLVGGGHKEFFKQPYIIFSFVAVIIGLIFILCDELSVVHMCLVWGILDIVRSAYEIFDAIRELKHDKWEIVEIVAGTADLILGILLTIEKEEGITMHLIIMGAALILIGLRFIAHLVISSKHKEIQHE